MGVDLNSVKTGQIAAGNRPNYHHGDLREALIKAADEIIAEGGIEAFTLRTAAMRAGVSPAAPAHHFGNAKGLLTEVAILAYRRVDRLMAQARCAGDPVANARSLSLAYISFALHHPGHFRLLLRNDLVNDSDPRLSEASKAPGLSLKQALASYGIPGTADAGGFDEPADLLSKLATLHGLAHLVLENKAMHFFPDASAANFLQDYLPKIIERLYPDTR